MKELTKKIFQSFADGKIDSDVTVDMLTYLKLGDHANKGDIAITGMSCRFPGANNIDEFWDMLKSENHMVGPFPKSRIFDAEKLARTFLGVSDSYQYTYGAYLEDIDKFDCRFFKILPKEADLMDPNQRIFLEVSYDAIRDAGYEGLLKGSRTGVYLGHDSWPIYGQYIMKHKPDAVTSSIAGNVTSVIASRISYLLDLNGPAMLIDTACSSSLVAIHTACKGIQNGDCDVALAGGINISFMPVEDSMKIGQESKQRMVRTFDINADGFVWGEGAAAVLLKPLDKAIDDQDQIYAIIKGSSINQDGTSMGIMAPNARAQAKGILDAWKESRINPRDISYIELHGTGTKIGDPIEKEGITLAFNKHTNDKQFCAVGSVKTNIGHLDSASGIASVVKMALSLKEKTLPATLHFTAPNEELHLHESPLYVNTKSRNWDCRGEKRICGINSFGISGTNVHLIMEEAPLQQTTPHNDNEWNIMTVSAKTPKALRLLLHRYRSYFVSHPEINFKDACYTANVRRNHWEHRVCILFRSRQDLAKSLDELCLNSDKKTENESIFVSSTQNSSETVKTNSKIEVLPLDNPQLDKEYLKDLCIAYVNGSMVDWATVIYKKVRPTVIHFPSYPFERERHWVEGDVAIDSSKSFEQSIVVGNTIEKTKMKSKMVNMQRNTNIKIKNILAQISGLEIENISESISFLEMGFDSISLIKIKQAIMDLFDVEVTMRQFLGDLSNFTLLVQYVEKNMTLSEEDDSLEIQRNEAIEGNNLVKDYQFLQSSTDGEENDTENEYYQSVINQQLELMEKQIELLSRFDKDRKSFPLTKREETQELSTNVPENKTQNVLSPTDMTSKHKSLTMFGSKLPSKKTQDSIREFIKKYSQKTKASKILTDEYRSVLANNRNVAGYRHDLKEIVYQIIADRAAGSKIWDIDGNEYIDISMGFGIYLFGHYPDFIQSALLQELETGMPIGPMNALAGKAAKLLCEITNNERVAFFNTGTEAVMVAMRIARAVTKNDKIVIFSGSYHGTFDGVLARAHASNDANRSAPIAPGITNNLVKDVIVLKYDTQDALIYIRENAHQIAAVLVEPVQSRYPNLQPHSFLHELRDLTKQTDIALIFDEVILGFRIHPKGAQGYFNIKADIVIYGKIIGGGLPIGAVAGCTKFMESIDGGVWNYGDDSSPIIDERRTFVAGTFCNNPLVMSATCAVLQEIKEKGPNIQKDLNQKTSMMIKRLNNYFAEREISIHMVNYGSLFRFDSQVDITLLYYHLLFRGIYIWEGRNCFLSTAHSDKDIDQFIWAVEDSLDEMIKNGYFPCTATGVQKRYPLSQEQKQIWFTIKTKQFNMPLIEKVVLRIIGELNTEAMEKAVNGIVERHELLRSRIDATGYEQEIYLPGVADIEIMDFTNQDKEEIEKWLEKENVRDFDIVNEYMFSFSILKEDEGSHLIVAAFHHMIADGWSISVLIDELCVFYNAYCQGELPLLSKATQFDEYLYKKYNNYKSQAWGKSKSYWLNQYKKPVVSNDIPTDYIIGNTKHQARKISSSLCNSVYEDLKMYSVRTQTTVYAVLFSAFTIMMKKLTGSSDIVIGIAFAGQVSTGDFALVGQCVNVLPFRLNINDLDTYEQIVDTVKEKLLEGMDHQMFSFMDLEDNKKTTSNQPKVRYLFNMDKTIEQLDFSNLNTEILPNNYSSMPYNLSVNVVEISDTLHIDMEYNANLYKREHVEYWLDQYLRLLELMVKSPEGYILPDLSIQSDKNNIMMASSLSSNHQLIHRPSQEDLAVHVNKEDDAASPIAEEVIKVAKFLTKKIKKVKNTTVGICISNAADQAVVTLGVLKAGMSYLIIPLACLNSILNHPKFNTVATIIKDSTDNNLIKIKENQIPVYKYNDILQWNGADVDWRETKHYQGGSILYIDSDESPTFFSVSGKYLTSRFKNISNFYEMCIDDKVLQYGEASFDGAIEILVPSLCAGAKLIPRSTFCSIDEFYQLVVDSGATIVSLPIDRLKEWGRLAITDTGNIRLMVFIGEMFSTADIIELNNFCNKKITVCFAYRPEGIPISLSVNMISCGDYNIVNSTMIEKLAIGTPIVSDSMIIANDAMQKAEIDEFGFLYLAADMLYLDNYKSNPKIKINHIQKADSTVEYYRSNVVARYTFSNEIEHICRDGDITNSTEIGSSLRVMKDVFSSTVLLIKENKESEDTPVLFVHVDRYNGNQIVNDIRNCLPERFSAMKIIIMENWPMRYDGKIDKNALINHCQELSKQKVIDMGLPHEEQILIKIWSEILNIDSIGIHENFFVMGGYSLMAIQLIARISEAFSLALSLQILIDYPTIAEIASLIRENQKSQEELENESHLLPEIVPDPDNRWKPFPLTSVQQAYWVGRSGAFELGNISTHTYFEIDSDTLDIDRIESVWRMLIERHDMLRAVIMPDGLQKILPTVPSYLIKRYDLNETTLEEAEKVLAGLRDRMSHQVLSPDEWPLFEICAALLPNKKVRVFFSIDALILDTWSFQILLDEMSQLYQNSNLYLQPLELSFRDYVMTNEKCRASDTYAKSRDYWLQRLDTLPPAPDLPLAMKPADIKNPKFIRHSRRLESSVWADLKKVVAQYGITQSGILMAAYAEVLSLWCTNPRFTINLTLFNPIYNHPQIEHIVGDFTSLTLLEIDNTEYNLFENRAKNVQKQLWNDLNHRFFSGVEVIRELNHRKGKDGQVSMPIVFTGTLNTASEAETGSTEWMGEIVYTIGQTPQVWLDFEVFEENGCLVLNWDSVEGLFQESVIEGMFRAYYDLLCLLADNNSIWKADRAEVMKALLPISHVEKISVINDTTIKYDEKLLHESFYDRVIEAGKNPAIITSERCLTYEELFIMANNLGHQLREMGALPNALIAIVMEKGWEQIIAVMGILFAGSAYLPVSSSMPQERLWTILDDAEVEFVLVQSTTCEILDFPDTVKVLEVKYDKYIAGNHKKLTFVQDHDDLAYVIYTSGSTGIPKGVMISHKGAWNTVDDINTRFQVSSSDIIFAISSLNFDLSVYDIFGLLSSGGAVIIPDAGEERNPAHWLDMITQYNVTIWNSVPALFEMLVLYAKGNLNGLLSSLRLAMLSGDWIPVSLPQQVWDIRRDVEIIGMGGATEASIWSCIHPITSVLHTDKSIPYGKPLRNQKMYILNDMLQLCPAWVTGKIYIGGIGLAQGYWHDEQKTNESFIIHPHTGERLYYTGDLGKYHEDGIIEFLGRIDNQVKINGYRIELGDVENVIRKHPNVSNAAVVAVGSEKNKKNLVGYVVLANKQNLDNINTEDPIERFRFKQKQIGICRNDSKTSISLPRRTDSETTNEYFKRRSFRQFTSSVISLKCIGFFMDSLSQIKPNDSVFPKYRYGSAGGLYPIQTYVYIVENKVEGISKGFYYYHPVNHSLDEVGSHNELTIEIDNQLMHNAAFILFLVTDFRAIEPLYGSDSERFSTLEAGIVSQLMEIEGPKHMIGVCQFGNLDAPGIRNILNLDDKQLPLHCLVAGAISEQNMGYEGYMQEMQSYHELHKMLETTPEYSNEEVLENIDKFIRDRLPGYMVPVSITELDDIPLSANGKNDYKKLKERDEANMKVETKVQQLPQTDIEKLISKIMQEIVGIERINIHDNFFDLGASSVDLIRFHNQLQEVLEITLPVVEIFQNPNISALATYITGQKTTQQESKTMDNNRKNTVIEGKNRLKRLNKQKPSE